MEMITFRADVSDDQLDTVELPNPLPLDANQARMIGLWASGLCSNTFIKPGHDPHFSGLRGTAAKGASMLMDGRLSKMIKRHVDAAERHSLTLSMGSRSHGAQIYLRVDRVREEPILMIPKATAIDLLSIIGWVDPEPKGIVPIENMERVLSRSQSKCVDHCMGHYHSALLAISVFARANGAKSVSWNQEKNSEGSATIRAA